MNNQKKRVLAYVQLNQSCDQYVVSPDCSLSNPVWLLVLFCVVVYFNMVVLLSDTPFLCLILTLRCLTNPSIAYKGYHDPAQPQTTKESQVMF